MDASRTSSAPVRAGFIGVGNFVSGNHLPNMAASKLWTIHGICDIDETNRARAEERYQPSVVTPDYHDLLDCPEIEVILVGTGHKMHARLAGEAAQAGKDVFVEKPMCATATESRAMVQAVQQAGTRLMVGYNRRFAPAMIAAKQAFHARNHGKPAMITYRAVDDARLWPDYPFDPKRGGGKVLIEACHFYDLLCWFLEDEPERVQCEGWREDNNFIQLAFAGGSIASIISGGWGSAKYPKERLEVFSDSSTLVIDHFLELALDGYEGIQDQTFEMLRDPSPEQGACDSWNGYHQRMRLWRDAGFTEEEQQRKAYYHRMPQVDKGHFSELEAFARAIRSHAPSPCDEIDGARATAIALKAIASIESHHQPQRIDPEEYFLSSRRQRASA